jgi:hypothetical protein
LNSVEASIFLNENDNELFENNEQNLEEEQRLVDDNDDFNQDQPDEKMSVKEQN